MSWKAPGELTEAGRASPLTAHETVLLRATFTLGRYRTIVNAREGAPQPFADDYRYEINNQECPVCWPLERTTVKGHRAAIFPPQGCVCVTANYSLMPYVGWLAGLD